MLLLRTLRACAFALLATFAPAAAAAETGAAEVRLSTPDEIEEAFLRGLRLLDDGNPRAAAILFRRILAGRPDLTRVRLELARAYFQMRSWPEARAEFVAVLSGGVPEEVKRNILRFINAIDARRGFDWNASLGVSTGPAGGRSYDTDIVELEFLGTVLPFEVARTDHEDLGVSFQGAAELRRPFREGGDGAAAIGFAAASADLFDAPGAVSDDHFFGVSAGSRFVWPQTTAFAAATGGLRWKGGARFEDSFGFEAGAERRTISGYAPFAAASWARIANHRTSAQDRDLSRAGLGVSKSVFGAATVGVAVGFERADARAASESYRSVDFSLFGRADLGAGLNATMRAAVRRDRYDAKAPLFLAKRRDTRLDVDLEVVKNDILLLESFSPFVSVGYTRNDSSLGIFSYDEYRFRIGVRNSF